MIKMRSSSTVILLRKKSKSHSIFDKHAFEIYVMKRPQTMRSFKGYTVFPGGLLEPQDQQSEWEQYIHNKLNTHELLPKRSDYPVRTSEVSRKESIQELPYVVAAIREVFEETGILVCQSERDEHGIKMPQHPTLQRHRQALLNKEITFFEMIKSLDIHLDAQKLFYIGRRITPPPTSIFFDANFYLTIVPENTTSIPSIEEVESDDWIEPTVALKRIEQKGMICAPATIECFYALNTLKSPES